MAQPLSNLGLPPGAYAQFQSTELVPNLAGGLRVAALVGTGITNATVIGETVTKGALNTSDALQYTATSLPSTITDENYVTYDEGRDYQLTSGEVDWSLANPAIQTGTVSGTSFAVDGLDLQLIVGGSALTDIVFTGGNPVTIGDVVNQINGTVDEVVASDDGDGHVVLTTVETDNTTLQIGTGTANGALGFTAGIMTESSQEPLEGVKYTLNYQRAKAGADFGPTLFFDINSLISAMGSINTDNTLSMGGWLAFQNGASAVMVVQIDPGVTPELIAFQQAIDKLQMVNCNIVVPLTTDPNLYPYVKAHVDNMSSLIEQKFRTALLGLGGSPTIPQIQTYAASLHDRRVGLVYPPSATMFLPGDSTATTVDGSMLAAAIAGVRTNPVYDVAEPLLRKQLIGFNSIQDTLLRTQKNVIANAGVLIVDNENGVPTVRDGLTTDLDTADSAEISVTDIIDFTATTARTFLDAAFVGTKFLNDVPNLMGASLNIILQSLVDNKIITDFTNVQVKRNGIDPRQVDVSFQIAPVFPVKWILITFTI